MACSGAAGADVEVMGWQAERMPMDGPVGSVFVREVAQGGWAAQLGVQPGDRVVLINGRPPEQLTREEVILALKGRPVDLAFDRPEGPPALERSALRRALIDYDSTLNPGQGNAPLTRERALQLSGHLERWRNRGLELYVLTASNPDKKAEALEAAGLAHLFAGILSSTLPKKFASKGDFIQSRVAAQGWRPDEQVFLDDSIEAVQSVFQDADGVPRAGGPLAHTLRLPQHSRSGLLEEDLQLVGALVEGSAPGAALTHRRTFQHHGAWVVDFDDSAEKCLLDALPEESRGQVLLANSPEKRAEWLKGRPDLLELFAAAEAAAAAAPAPTAPPRAKAAAPKGAAAKAAWRPPAERRPAAAEARTAPAEAAAPKRARVVGAPPQAPPPPLAVDLSRLEALVRRLEAVAARWEAAGAPLSSGGAPAAPASPPCRAGGAPPRALAVDLAGLEGLAARLERVASCAGA